MRTIKYVNNEEGWRLEMQLKNEGYVKTSDCFWCQIYKKGDDVVMLERI